MTEVEEIKGDTDIFHNVTHYKQRYNWDCGVTCVLMLLDPQQQEYMLQNFNDICHEEGFGQCTWTIDLCYLLKRFEIPHVMYTSTIGVNEAYQTYEYYDKIIKMDRRRVQSRFARAGGAGLDVRERRGGLAPHELAAQLRRGPLILLIDASLLSCDLCYYNKFRLDFRWCLGGHRYRGHYVVLCGLRGTRAYYCDPARGGRGDGGGGRGEGVRGGRGRVCAAPLERVLRAHRAVGTDHDAILIYKDYTRT